ncbi:MarR family transcriptional regulator [Myxococcota bacterium]|nr:MarR family transcriptional regulator [Myxococcota bacterium]MBU1430498.1 MarR family transcriptional regulator [Myxococcota bacterium]MBU1899079.1 MarR family transcriptional regulator [Myxococcota bacterium]
MTPQENIADEVLMTIRQIVRRISEHSKSLSRVAGLTVPQLLCLKAIGELERHEAEITVARVSKAVQLSAATTSRILDRLVRAGLVERQRGEVDRRRVSLSLTATGRVRFGALPTPLQEAFIERLNGLEAVEREGLLVALRRIAELMEAERLDAAPILALEMDLPDELD